MSGMLPGIAVLLGLGAVSLAGQQQSSTRLSLRVMPEAYVSPPVLTLRFTIHPDGAPPSQQTFDIVAMVRALPGQSIEIAPSATELRGPAGSIPARLVQFRGVRTLARSGAESASCASGSIDGSSLVRDWVRSGVLSCAVSFSLAPGRYVPGTYNSTLTLKIVTR